MSDSAQKANAASRRRRLGSYIASWTPLLLVAVSILAAAPGCAEELPAAWTLQVLNGSGKVPHMQLPAADPIAYLEEHEAKFGIHARNVLHIAPKGFKEVDVAGMGVWQTLSDGTCLWSLDIRSDDASSHVLVFSDLTISWTGEFVVYSPEESLNRTRCVHSCMRVRGTDIPSRKLTTLAMQGSEVRLEYHHPAAEPPEAAFVVRIGSIMQGMQGMNLIEAAAAQQERRKQRRHLLDKVKQPGYTPGTGFNMAVLQQTSDSVSTCTPSVLCDPLWDRMGDAVLDIYAINLDLGAMAVCTGTMITAPLGRSYLLTADHCFVDKDRIGNFDYWVLIMNYEQPCNSKEVPALKQVMQGVRLVFYDSIADILLLEIPEPIPDKFQPYLMGFDASVDAVPKHAVSIHHPNGGVKRISYANDSGSISTSFTALTFPRGEVQPTDASHYQIIWWKGATASGSSGSPLIDLDTRKVVGVLTGGFASCAAPKQPDYYGRLSAAWVNGLEHFLSSNPPADVLPDVADILYASSSGGEIIVRTMNGSAGSRHGPALGMYPRTLTFSPLHDINIFTYYLTDPPPFDNETIHMNITVRGTIPGNAFDASPYVSISQETDAFTSSDVYTYRRSMTVSVDGLNATSYQPGNMLRFQLLFRLTSNLNSNYLHIHRLKGIIQASTGPWTQYKPWSLECTELPCFEYSPGRNESGDADPNFNQYLDYNSSSEIGTDPRLAIFNFQPRKTINAQLDLCLEQDVLLGATVSVYINQKFTWTLSKDPFGDPNCIHIASITASQGANYTVVVSDEDSFDAVLPLRTVRYIYVADTAVEVVSPEYITGPVMGGEPAGAEATKAAFLPLPPAALPSI